MEENKWNNIDDDDEFDDILGDVYNEDDEPQELDFSHYYEDF